jgi:hypothetical protein
MEQEDMGPLEAWQIREFPRELRQAVINEAKARRMSPGEFATRIFVAARQAGWDSFAPAPSSKGGQLVTTGPQPSAGPQGDGLSELIQMARAMTPPDKDSEAMRLARSMVRDRLQAIRQSDGLQTDKRKKAGPPLPRPKVVSG